MVKRVVYNALSWLVFVLFRSFVKRVFLTGSLRTTSSTYPRRLPTWKYVLYLQYFIQGVLATNILQALFYLVQPQDKYADLPMTDEQRELMGLPKLNKKTDIKNVPTPPKYVRNSPGSMNFPRPNRDRDPTRPPRLRWEPFQPLPETPLWTLEICLWVLRLLP